MQLQTTKALRPASALYAIQNDGIDLILKNDRAGLFWGPGLGKTITVGASIAKLMDAGEVRRVLYICPPRVVGVARREFAKWECTHHINVVDVVGSPEKRLKLLQGDAPGVYCISFSVLQWLLKVAPTIKGFQLLVIDESSKVGDPSTKVTKAAAKLATAIKRCVILTGTPGDMSRIWSQVFCLDKGDRLGTRYLKYLDRYCVQAGFRWVARQGSRQAVSEKLKDLCFSASARDHVGDLPSVIRTTIEVDLPPEAQRLYEQMELAMIADLGSVSVRAKTPAVVVGKLMQLADGVLYADAGEKSAEIVHTAKLDAVKELLDECGENDPAIVLYRYRASAAQLLDSVPGAEPFKADTVEAD